MVDGVEYSISLELKGLCRQIRQHPNYVLGVTRCLGEGSSFVESVWIPVVHAFKDQLSREPGSRAIDLDSMGLDPKSLSPSLKSRYNVAQYIASRRKDGVVMIDLGQNDTLLSLHGRHCDGVVLLVDGETKVVRRWLRSMERENIPWLGYCKVEQAVRQELNAVA
jgi:hypothetical protein